MTAMPISSGNAPLCPPKASCQTCRLRELCLPIGLTPTEVQKLDGLVNRRQRIRARQHIFRAGKPFHFLYAVRAGTYKLYEVSVEGHERVNGFYLGGDILGLDAINTGIYPSNAIALEDGEVCEIPFSALEDLVRDIPALQHQLHRLLSREISEDHRTMRLLSTMSAEQKVTVFLLNLSARLERLHYSPNDLYLRMSREEMGSYLGLTIETVSRTLRRLQDDLLITVDRRQITLIDIDAMSRTLPLNSCAH